jgi:hypothetical protein
VLRKAFSDAEQEKLSWLEIEPICMNLDWFSDVCLFKDVTNKFVE